MKFLLFLSLAVVAISAVPNISNQWTNFKTTHNKKYENITEEAHRKEIFIHNHNEIEKHNQLFAEGKVTYTKAINQFGDLTAEEFLAYVNMNQMPKRKPVRRIHKICGVKAAADVDWRTRGVVTPVKDQGQCGSCWSFSATGALEGQYAINHGKLISLSEQHLVDCSYKSIGCAGGWMDDAFEYVIEKGIALESEYPYIGVDDCCSYEGNSALTATSYVDIPSGSEGGLEDAIKTVGPIAVGMDVTYHFQFYSSGIFHDPTCTAEALNHGVLAVGYGSNYWLVKNSWGESWGDSGYFKLAREGDHCGLTAAASYPIVK